MKVGIVGAGTIVPDFLRAQSSIDEIETVAISGTNNDEIRMKQLAEEYRISEIYIDYEKMFKRSDIDTAYIAVPNSLHFTVARAAISNGLHVILENPFTSNKEEAEELIRLSKKNHCYLFDAVSTIYYPNYLMIKEKIKDIGNVKIVQINYSQYSRRYDQFKNGVVLPVFDPKKAGGALMDLNVYNVNLVVGIFGKPQSVHYYANIERGIDTSGVLILDYADFKCVSIAAKDCKAPCCISIQGDKGYIYSDKPANTLTDFFYYSNDGDKKKYELNEFGAERRMVYELKAFANALKMNDAVFMESALSHSLAVIEILDEARSAAGIEFK